MSFNMEIFDSGSSQNSDLGQEQLNNMEESAKADNTKRATNGALIVLRNGKLKEEFPLTGRQYLRRN